MKIVIKISKNFENSTFQNKFKVNFPSEIVKLQKINGKNSRKRKIY